MFFEGVESRISQSQKFCKIDVKNVHRKTPVLQSLFNKSWSHLCWSLFIKKRLQHRCLSVNNVEFLRTAFLYGTPLVIFSEKRNIGLK